jgi:ABC-2 type transport system permease protein
VTAQKVVSVLPLFLLMLLIGFTFNVRLSPPLWSALAFIPAVVLAGLLRFFVQFGLSCLAFWTTQLDASWRTYMVVQTFLGGFLAPLALMPPVLQLLATILPFRWIFTFPIELMLGRLNWTQALQGFGAQITWVVLSFVLMHVTWNAGVRRYAAVGG